MFYLMTEFHVLWFQNHLKATKSTGDRVGQAGLARPGQPRGETNDKSMN